MTDQTEALSAVVEREFPHPPEKLWRAITQPHLIAEWLMPNDFAPEVGHHFQMKGDWGGTLECEVLEVDPCHTLAYRWDFPNDNPAFDVRTVLTFTLTPAAGGTHLRVEQAGFRPGQKQAHQGAIFGWQKFLGNLDALLPKVD
jgi:uncharacterized protein YndB with AHSA1/START domain